MVVDIGCENFLVRVELDPGVYLTCSSDVLARSDPSDLKLGAWSKSSAVFSAICARGPRKIRIQRRPRHSATLSLIRSKPGFKYSRYAMLSLIHNKPVNGPIEASHCAPYYRRYMPGLRMKWLATNWQIMITYYSMVSVLLVPTTTAR